MASYKAGKNSVVTINGTIRGIQDGSYDTGVAKDDMTNTIEGGFGRDIGTVKRANAMMTIVYDSDSPLDFDEGDEVVMSIVNPGCPGLSGTFLVDKMTNASIAPTKGVKIGVTMSSQGPYTKTGGA